MVENGKFWSQDATISKKALLSSHSHPIPSFLCSHCISSFSSQTVLFIWYNWASACGKWTSFLFSQLTNSTLPQLSQPQFHSHTPLIPIHIHIYHSIWPHNHLQVTSLTEGANLRSVLNMTLKRFREADIEIRAIRVMGGDALKRLDLMSAHYGVINTISKQGTALILVFLINPNLLMLSPRSPLEISSSSL